MTDTFEPRKRVYSATGKQVNTLLLAGHAPEMVAEMVGITVQKVIETDENTQRIMKSRVVRGLHLTANDWANIRKAVARVKSKPEYQATLDKLEMMERFKNG